MAAKPQIIRLLTLGDSGAGKSSLLLRYTQNEFNVEYMPTIGIDFRLKTVEVNGKTVKVQVWVRLDNNAASFTPQRATNASLAPGHDAAEQSVARADSGFASGSALDCRHLSRIS
jgi:GTPase SAR1 family protein